jgi:hypothetical protein
MDARRDTAAIAVLLRGFATPQTARKDTVPKVERNRAISVRCLLLAPVQAASHRFELIPIALQRGCVEIVNTFSKPGYACSG